MYIKCMGYNRTVHPEALGLHSHPPPQFEISDQ